MIKTLLQEFSIPVAISLTVAVGGMDISGVQWYVTIPGTNGVITIGSIASNAGMYIQHF
jgi:hypothetical protein